MAEENEENANFYYLEQDAIKNELRDVKDVLVSTQHHVSSCKVLVLLTYEMVSLPYRKRP